MSIISQNSISNTSVKVYDNLVEVYRLDKGWFPASDGGIRGQSNKSEKVKKQYQEQAALRAGTVVRELVLANDLRYLWTLTYSADVDKREEVATDFRLFVLRLNYAMKDKLDYVAVLEVQEERAKRYGVNVLHVHFACNRWMDVRLVSDVWGHGFVFVSEHAGNLLNVAGYLSKYVKKGFHDARVRPVQKRRYFSSKGLQRPVRYTLYLSDAEAASVAARAAVTAEFDGAKWYQIKDGDELFKGKVFLSGEQPAAVAPPQKAQA